MEKEIWIEKIMNSTNGMTQVTPSDDLFSRIKEKIKAEQKVAPQTLWLVAASIIVLVILNITVLKTKTTTQQENSNTYLFETINPNNQFYQ
jgi:hypothetical protein